MVHRATTTQLICMLWLVNAIFVHGEELLLETKLTVGLQAALERIPKHRLASERLAAVDGRFTSPQTRDGIPEGVDCDPVERCDSRNVCARVCARGSVRLDPWLQQAVAYQWRLSRAQPLCLAQLLGTHNSAITLADGYGMHDELYTSYLRYLNLVHGGQGLVTNNQVLSLTDQLNLGVRFVELDVHWIQSGLYIAHCGGFHSARLNALVAALSAVAAWFGHPPVEWDAETLGCSPSLSSLPARDQRLFSDAVAEVAAWLAAPGNEAEFIVLYLDDQMDLATWGRVPELLAQVTAAFPRAAILTPPELADLLAQGGSPPSIESLVSRHGKRLLLMSAADYGAAMSHTAFNHSSPCGLAEPLFQRFTAAPSCSFAGWRRGRPALPAMSGRLLRTPTCRLTYGPYNCSLKLGENTPQLDSELLPGAVSCGINVPAPDLLTPDLLAAAVWSWAPGHLPPPAPGQQGQQGQQGEKQQGQEGEEQQGAKQQGQEGRVSRVTAAAAAAAGSCAVMRSGDGRWEMRPCAEAAWAACRLDAGPAHIPDSDGAADSHSGATAPASWVLVPALAACPPGYLPGAPHTARESYDLWQRLAAAAAEAKVEAEALDAGAEAATAGGTGDGARGGAAAGAAGAAAAAGLSPFRRQRRQLLASKAAAAVVPVKAARGGVISSGGGSGSSKHADKRHEETHRLGGGADAGGGVYAILALQAPEWLPAGLAQPQH